jgi:hypothetical protein
MCIYFCVSFDLFLPILIFFVVVCLFISLFKPMFLLFTENRCGLFSFNPHLKQ